MFEINHRKVLNIIHLKDVFYANKMQMEHPGYDAVYYFNSKESYRNAKEFKTLLIDLTLEPEEILRSFRKQTRTQIEKAIASPLMHFFVSDCPKDQEMEAFFHGYDNFSRQKGITKCNRKFLKRLQASGKLSIATALIGDETVCQFALINVEEKAICYHGYNNRFLKLEDTDWAKSISQANRALEYHCMIHAKKEGKKYYDLCGVTLDPNNPAAEKVDHYKRAFSGQLVTEYHFIYPVTFKGRIFCWLKKLMGGI